MKPLDLPVYQHKDVILEALAAHQVVVVESPTGSGKTTQIPQILLEAGYARRGQIGVTQPRRIAAVSVSEFIARQLGVKLPEIVGYAMRFEDRTDPALTRIKIMTDGILLQEIKGDPLLSRYSVLMVDEAHERSLNIDFILGLLKRVLRERPDFKVIVSSATINAEVFSEYFDECPIVKIDARTYPVDVVYDPPETENDSDALLAKIVSIVDRCHRQKRGGGHPDLPARGGVDQGRRRRPGRPALPQEAADPAALRPPVQRGAGAGVRDYPGRRKVIIATNIAETSVTIDGVTVVIDPGQAKVNFYNPRTFTSSLVEVPVSRASANQRRGRAGRTQPGVCYRLYRPEDFDRRPLFTTEEIYRTDLSEVVLRMAELGIREFESFDFLSPPDRRRHRRRHRDAGLPGGAGRQPRAHRDGAADGHLPHPAAPLADHRGGDPPLPGRAGGGAHRRLLPLHPQPLPAAPGGGAGGAAGAPRLPRPAGGLRLLPEALPRLPGQPQPGEVLRAALPGSADHARDRQHQGAARRSWSRPWACPSPRAATPPPTSAPSPRGLIQFVCARTGRGIYRDPHRGAHPDPPLLGDVPRGPGLHRGRGDRAHLADVRPLRLAAEAEVAAADLLPALRGAGPGPAGGEGDGEEGDPAGLHQPDPDRPRRPSGSSRTAASTRWWSCPGRRRRG